MSKIKYFKLITIIVCMLLILKIDCNAYSNINKEYYDELFFDDNNQINKKELYDLIIKYKGFFENYIIYNSLPVESEIDENGERKAMPVGFAKVNCGDIRTLDQLKATLNKTFTEQCTLKIIKEYFNNNLENSNYKIIDNDIYTRSGERGHSPCNIEFYDKMRGKVTHYSAKDKELILDIYYPIQELDQFGEVCDVIYQNETYEFSNTDIGWRINSYKQISEDNKYRFEDRYNRSEVHGDMAYIIANKNGYKPGWTDILWRMDAKGNVTKMYEARGINFKVSEDNSRIVINTDKLIFLNIGGKVIKELEKKDVISEGSDENYLTILDWESNNKYIWATAGYTWSVNEFIRINTETWEVKNYKNNLPFYLEYTLDVDTGWVAYSDYPVIFDIYDREEFIKSNKEVSLWVHNIFTYETIKIESVRLNRFNPEWIWKGKGKLRYDIRGDNERYELPEHKINPDKRLIDN